MTSRRVLLGLLTAFAIVPGAVDAASKPGKAAPKTAPKTAKTPAPKTPAVPPVLPVEPSGLADMIMGDPKAPVTLVEYGSVACPYCAHFNETVFPQIKANYIDTGKVRYIYRPMITGVSTIAVSGHRLAECAGKDRYFNVIDAVMRGQRQFYAMGENDMLARPVLKRIALDFGLDDTAFAACVTDPAAVKTMKARNTKYLESGIKGTPAFFINGRPFDYKDGGIAEFDAAFAAARPN